MVVFDKFTRSTWIDSPNVTNITSDWTLWGGSGLCGEVTGDYPLSHSLWVYQKYQVWEVQEACNWVQDGCKSTWLCSNNRRSCFLFSNLNFWVYLRIFVGDFQRPSLSWSLAQPQKPLCWESIRAGLRTSSLVQVPRIHGFLSFTSNERAMWYRMSHWPRQWGWQPPKLQSYIEGFPPRLLSLIQPSWAHSHFFIKRHLSKTQPLTFALFTTLPHSLYIFTHTLRSIHSLIPHSTVRSAGHRTHQT